MEVLAIRPLDVLLTKTNCYCYFFRMGIRVRCDIFRVLLVASATGTVSLLFLTAIVTLEFPEFPPVLLTVAMCKLVETLSVDFCFRVMILFLIYSSAMPLLVRGAVGSTLRLKLIFTRRDFFSWVLAGVRLGVIVFLCDDTLSVVSLVLF